VRPALAILVLLAPLAPAGCSAPVRDRLEADGEALAIEPPQTVVWVVAGGACTRLTFVPDAPGSGTVLIRGARVSYATEADRMELRGASSSAGEGVVARPCRTELGVGPGATLGGADVFAEEARCLAARATAAALDDSPEATARRCRGERVPVTTDEVVCGAGGRYSVVAGKPGCVGVALAGMVAGP